MYTILLGGYERLTEQDVARESGLDFLCLTDDPALESETWTIRHVQPLFAHDMTRSQRVLKIRAHEALPDYDVSLYIDNSVLLQQTPERVLADLLPPERSFAAMAHSFRTTVAAEFLEVVRLGLDARDRCAEQERHYRLRDPASLLLRPLKAALLLRRHHDPLVVTAAELWAAHILRYSRRDQLSLWFCLREVGLEPVVHELDNFESPYHRWPVSVGRRPRDRPWPDGVQDELDAARARIAQLEREIAVLHRSRSWRWTGTARRITAAWRGPDQPSNSSTSPEPSQAATSR